MRHQCFKLTSNKFLCGSLLAVSICIGQSAMADEPFTKASLQGSYAYVNNTSNVASLGPITFDGHGALTVDIIANLPCATPVLNCPRVIDDLPRANGTYDVRPDGTGVATINFLTGAVKYNFMISEDTQKGTTRLATQIFAVGQKGGLAGQLIAPTWTRISRN